VDLGDSTNPTKLSVKAIRERSPRGSLEVLGASPEPPAQARQNAERPARRALDRS
jgi:hypothetical protein